jgi:hypothetical protein
VKFTQYFVTGMIASGLMVVGFQSLAIQIPIERERGYSSGCGARRCRRRSTSWARSGWSS